MASKTAITMNLRLLVNKKTGKILYAEAGKDFVDLLFSFLTLPTGSVIKLFSALKSAKRVGCITNIYNSVDKLQSMFMNAEKSQLLEPKVMSPHSNDILKLESPPAVFYICGADRANYPSTHYMSTWSDPGTHYMSTRSGDSCACGQSMIYAVQLQKSGNKAKAKGRGSSRGGYVKETVTFIIADDLEISPSSTITSVNLLNKLNVKELTDLAEQKASVGANEALELLWASLVSTTPLNDVFGVVSQRR